MDYLICMKYVLVSIPIMIILYSLIEYFYKEKKEKEKNIMAKEVIQPKYKSTDDK